MRALEKIGLSGDSWRPGQRAIAPLLTGGGQLASPPLGYRLRPTRTLAALLAERTVVVTGASSGIGQATALELANAGTRVVLVARSSDKLHALRAEIERRGGTARIYAADRSSAEGTAGLLARLAADSVEPDVLINNAGRSIRRTIADSSGRVHDYERTMALNCFGAIRLILGLPPAMRARGRGHINVSTAGTQMGTPLIAPTAAFRDAPALSPEEAARLLLRALITKEAT